jgi:integrase
MQKSTTPGIYKRGKTWTVHINWTDPNGDKHQHKRGGFQRKAEAKQYQDRYRSEIHTGRRLGTSKLRVGDYLTREWLPQRKADLKQSTYASYVNCVNTHIIPHIGNTRLEELSVRKVEQFYRTLQTEGRKGTSVTQGEGLSPKTVSNVAGVLHRSMRDAVRWGHIANNPIINAIKPSKKSPEMLSWQPNELGAFIEHTHNDRHAALWQLAATTGMRRGELLGLRWDDVDFKNKKISIHRARIRAGNAVIEETPKTLAGRRTISLDTGTITVLRQLKARQAEERLAMGECWLDTEGHVFTDPGGLLPNPNTVTRRFQALVKKAQLPRIRLHDVRHSYVVAARRAGVDIKTISQRIGHADTNVTLSVYDHVFQEDDTRAADDTATLIYARTK